MKMLYRIGMSLVSVLLPVLAPFNSKMGEFISGRKDLMNRLRSFKKKHPEKPIWFHVASLGEYEQAKPIIHELKARKPNAKLVVSFFSPSGYKPASKKDQPNVDFVTYLPLDLKGDAIEFVRVLDPSLAFFVKYDLWYEHIQALKNQNVPTFLVSALFRPKQAYFNSNGFFRKILFQLDHIFTQNEASLNLLSGIGYEKASITGDTRFDRVHQNAMHPQKFPQIESWIGDRKVVVLGSVWEEDMIRLIPLINSHSHYRWIIAPHDLNQEKMREWAKKLKLRVGFYTQAGWNDSPNVLFLDTMGMLSSVYQYAHIAYVGGGFGSGLHNILEPIGFKVPVIFGKVRLATKFPEAKLSQEKGCGFEIETAVDLELIFNKLSMEDSYRKASQSAENWLQENLGAAKKICDEVGLILGKS